MLGKKIKVSPETAALLRNETGLKNVDNAAGKLVRLRRLADEECAQFSRTCRDMQARVETAQEDLDRREAAFARHLESLAKAAGMTESEVTEAQVLNRIAALRELAERVRLFDRVTRGEFSPDDELRRRVACALGMSSRDMKAIVAQLNVVPELRTERERLTRELDAEKARSAHLLRKLDNDIDGIHPLAPDSYEP